ncbi:hypothetical protein BN2475_50092 [Paraburkholderia ribeironis]|uniref:Uncharacterized protein n=1 Tax=Paraburkholderia ribeironis TaxID=1247936 RepID=A0A1N7RKC4_9BURK|nr:hypothetical protein BN2475_50092 [Paraburkholderia ribeironis]
MTFWNPYCRAVLGQLPLPSFVRSELVNAALTVPNVRVHHRASLRGAVRSSAEHRSGACR